MTFGRILCRRREVLIFQHPAMVQLVCSDDVSNGAHGNFVLVANAAPSPRGFVKIAE